MLRKVPKVRVLSASRGNVAKQSLTLLWETVRLNFTATIPVQDGLSGRQGASFA